MMPTPPPFALTRRSLLGGVAAALAVRPSFGAAAADYDVAIVGAGAAGISAARRLAAAGKRFVIVEAAGHIGGRCITDMTTFGVPLDRGAHWIHAPELNPVAKLAPKTGLDIYPAPEGKRRRARIGQRYARESEMADYHAGFKRASQAIEQAAQGPKDMSCAQALPKDLGDWRGALEFVMGPWDCGKDLTDISVADFSRSEERDEDAFCRQGFGALLARLATGIPVQLSTAARAIDYDGSGVAVETAKGRIRASAAIVTVSTNMLLSGNIKFAPDLPIRYYAAASGLRLGSYDHITLEMPGNPLGLGEDEQVFERSSSKRTAGIFANVSGTSLCMIDVAGSFGRELSSQGEAAMIAFAIEWLSGLYGNTIKTAVKRSHATRWNHEPLILGGFSAAAPGGQPGRKVLMEPLRDRIWFAGEAVHEDLWGTVGGAWASGERAAGAVLKRLG